MAEPRYLYGRRPKKPNDKTLVRQLERSIPFKPEGNLRIRRKSGELATTRRSGHGESDTYADEGILWELMHNELLLHKYAFLRTL